MEKLLFSFITWFLTQIGTVLQVEGYVLCWKESITGEMVGREERWELTASCMWEIPGLGRIQWFHFPPSTGQQNPWDSSNAHGLQHAFNGTGQRIRKAAWDSTERCE